MQRVVVTGGAGFLGSHLCDRLITAGHDALCVDTLLHRKEIERHPSAVSSKI